MVESKLVLRQFGRMVVVPLCGTHLYSEASKMTYQIYRFSTAKEAVAFERGLWAGNSSLGDISIAHPTETSSRLWEVAVQQEPVPSHE